MINRHFIRIFIIVAIFFLFSVYCDIIADAEASGKIIRKAGKNQVALTFDDGPKNTHTLYTDMLLSVLKSKDVKATFFVLGRDVESNPSDLIKIYDAGHVIANHAYSHNSLASMDYDEIVEELRDCNKLVEVITGKRPRYVRPPTGKYNPLVLKAFNDENLTMVYWTNNPGDYHGWESGKILAEEILRCRGPGDIILLHLGVYETIEAVDIIIDAYREAGFEFVTVEQI